MFEEKLIEAVRNHPCLYDKKENSYRNKVLKEKAWTEVATITSQEIETCKTRWRSLRDRFVKETLKLSQPSGSGADEYRKGWEHYDSLLFLKTCVAPRKTSTSIMRPAPSSPLLQDSVFSVPSPSVPGPSEAFLPASPPSIPLPLSSPQELESPSLPSSATSSRKRKNDHLDEEFSAFLGNLQNIVQTQIQKPDEPPNKHKIFLDLLPQKLNQLPEENQENIKMEILNMVHKQIIDLRYKN